MRFFKCIIFLFCSLAYSQTSVINIANENFDVDYFLKTQKTNLELLGSSQTIEIFKELQLLKNYALREGAETDNDFLYKYSKALDAIEDSLFYPLDILEPILKRNFQIIQTENKVQILNAPISEKEKISAELKKKGVDFTELINKYSISKIFAEPQYIKPFTLEKSIEEVSRILENGEISQPILTNGQLVFVKKIHQRKNLGYLLMQKIETASKEKINEAYAFLSSGKDFSEAVTKFSEEPNKLSTYGKMDPVFGGLPDTMYEGIKNLKNKSFSEPIFYNGKYNIFYLYQRYPFEDYSKSRQYVKNITEKGYDIIDLEASIIDIISKSEEFIINTANIENAIKNAALYVSDSTTIQNEVLFSSPFFSYNTLEYIQELKRLQLPNMTHEIATLFFDEKLYQAEIDFYKSNYFFTQEHIKPIVKVKKEQLLVEHAITKINKEAYKDAEGIEKYYQNNIKNYEWKERAEIIKYYCDTEVIAKELYDIVKTNKGENIIKTKYENKINTLNQPLVLIENGKIQLESKDYPKNIPFKKGIYMQKLPTSKYVVIKIKKIHKPKKMTLSEAKPFILEKYPDYYYSEILKKLHKDFSVIINNDGINALKKQYP